MRRVLLIVISLVFMVGISGCKKENIDFNILIPAGAPALSQVSIHKEKPSLGKNINYEITLASGASVIPAAFSSGEYEVIFAPTNVGVMMYNNTGKYVMVSTITWGNLFFATTLDIDFTVESLNGKKVNLFGKGTINEIIVNGIFKENNITISDESTYESGTDITKNYLLTDPNSIVLIAEPVLSATKTALEKQGKTVKTLDVQELWKDITKSDSYPQAGVFMDNNFFTNNNEVALKYLEELKKSCELVNSSPDEVAKYAKELGYGLPEANILKLAIPNCNIRFVTAKDSKGALEKVLINNLLLPDSKFYAY